MQRTKIPSIAGILMAISLVSATGQDQKTTPSLTGPGAKVERAKRDLLSANTREKLSRLALSEKTPDIIVGKRFVLSGPLITLFKSDESLQSFNPFAAPNSRVDRDTVRIDPYLPTPRGFTLFRLQF